MQRVWWILVPIRWNGDPCHTTSYRLTWVYKIRSRALRSTLSYPVRYVRLQDLESSDIAEWQSFDLTGYTDQTVTSIGIEIKGTGSGAPGFALLDANILGTQIDNPTDTVYVSVKWAKVDFSAQINRITTPEAKKGQANRNALVPACHR